MVCLRSTCQYGDNELTCALTLLAGAASIQHVGTTVLAVAGILLHTKMAQASCPSGPFIQLPGFPTQLVVPSSRSQTVNLNPVGFTPGYNPNHIGYQATRAKMASNAYARVFITSPLSNHVP